MSTAEFLKMTELIMATNEKVSDLHTTVALNNQKTETALKQIDDKVDDVKEDVGAVKTQIEDLSKRLATLENRKSVLCGIKEFITNGFGFFSKYYKFVLAAIILFVVLFGSSLGLDAGAIIPVIMGLFGL